MSRLRGRNVGGAGLGQGGPTRLHHGMNIESEDSGDEEQQPPVPNPLRQPPQPPQQPPVPTATDQSIHRIKTLLKEYSDIQARIGDLQRLHSVHCFNSRFNNLQGGRAAVAQAKGEHDAITEDGTAKETAKKALDEANQEVEKNFDLKLTDDERDLVKFTMGGKEINIENLGAEKKKLEEKKEEIKAAIESVRKDAKRVRKAEIAASRLRRVEQPGEVEDAGRHAVQLVGEGLCNFFEDPDTAAANADANLRQALEIQARVGEELFTENETERLRGFKEVHCDLLRDGTENYQKYLEFYEDDGHGEMVIKDGVNQRKAKKAFEQDAKAQARIDAHRELVTQELERAIKRFNPMNPGQFFEQASALIDAGADVGNGLVDDAINRSQYNDAVRDILNEIIEINLLITEIEQRRKVEKKLREALKLNKDDPIPEVDLQDDPESEEITELRTKLAQLNDLGARPQALAFTAANDNNFEIARKLIDAGIIDKDSVDSDNGATLLHWAVSKENEQAVKYLLDKGVNRAIKDNRGHTPLYIAIDRKNARIATLIIEAKSKVKEGESVGEATAEVSLKAFEEMMAVKNGNGQTVNGQEVIGQTVMEFAFARGGQAAPIVFAAHGAYASLEKEAKKSKDVVKIQALFRGYQARKELARRKDAKLANDIKALNNPISDNLTKEQFNDLTKMLLAATYVLMNQGEKTSSSDMQFRDYFKEACTVLNGKGQFENYLYNCKRHSQGKIPVSNALMPDADKINGAFAALNKTAVKALIKKRRNDGKDVVIANPGAPVSVKNLLGIHDEGKNENRSAKKHQELENNITYYRASAAKLQTLAGTDEAGLNAAITATLNGLTAEQKKAFPYKDLVEIASGTDAYPVKIDKLDNLQTKAVNNIRSAQARIDGLPTSDANYYKEFAGVMVSNLTLTKEGGLFGGGFRGVIFDETCNIEGGVFENNNFYNCKTIAADNSLIDFKETSSVNTPFPIDDNVNYAAAKATNGNNFAGHDTNQVTQNRLTDFLEENGPGLLGEHFEKNATGGYIKRVQDGYDKETLDKGIKSLVKGQARAPHINRSVDRVMGKAGMIEHPTPLHEGGKINIKHAKGEFTAFFMGNARRALPKNAAQKAGIAFTTPSPTNGNWQARQFTEAYMMLKSLQDDLIDSTKGINAHLDGKNIDINGAQYPATKVSQYATALKSVIDEQLVKTLGDDTIDKDAKDAIIALSNTQKTEEVARHKENYAPSSSVGQPTAARMSGRSSAAGAGARVSVSSAL